MLLNKCNVFIYFDVQGLCCFYFFLNSLHDSGSIGHVPIKLINVHCTCFMLYRKIIQNAIQDSQEMQIKYF